MPSISENYEKVVLAGAVVAALGLGFFGWKSLSSVEEDFASAPIGAGKDDASVKGSDKVATAISSLTRPRVWTIAEADGRELDLFTGVPLFVNKKDTKNPVDLQKSKEVHSSIPNKWWLENRIDPGFADSPARDEDGDGFSNVEEFTAKTDPNDKTSHPSPISKLKYVGDDSVEWLLRPGFPGEGDSLTFDYKDTKRVVARIPPAEPIPKGQKFFKDGPIKERFEYVNLEVRQVFDERIQAEQPVSIVTVKDLKPNKAGKVYEIPAFFRAADNAKHIQFDRTALLSLDALGMAGQEIRVEEFTEFILPPGSKNKPFKMTEVTPERITIIETLDDGKTKTHVIEKGQTGKIGGVL
jgi:hypothetical protein